MPVDIFLSGTDTVNHVARWDGGQWNSLGKGMDPQNPNFFSTFVRAMQSYKGELYAGGQFYKVDTISSAFISKWDGIKWETPGFYLQEDVYSMEVYNNKLFIGGYFIDGPSNIHQVISWDSITIDNLNGGIVPNFNPWLDPIWDLQVYDNKLFAVGDFDSTYSFYSTAITFWNEPILNEINELFGSNNIEVYPNPASTDFIIEIPPKIKSEINIQLLSLDGKEVFSERISPSPSITIDSSKLSTGLYLLKIVQGNNIYFGKISIIK